MESVASGQGPLFYNFVSTPVHEVEDDRADDDVFIIHKTFKLLGFKFEAVLNNRQQLTRTENFRNIIRRKIFMFIKSFNLTLIFYDSET